MQQAKPAPQPFELSFFDELKLQGWRAFISGLTFYLNRSLRLPGELVEVSYGAHADERLDVLEPSLEVPERLPVVYIHGGGWVCGKKEAHRRALSELTHQGHRVFNLEYPVGPERPHPHMLLSLLQALAFVREQYGVQRLHLMGDSAGGNLAVMLAILVENTIMMPMVLPRSVKGLPKIASVVSLYGVLDRFSWLEDGFPSAEMFLKAYAGPLALEKKARPANTITPMDLPLPRNLPAIFIVAAQRDELLRSSVQYHKYIEGNFETVKFKVYEGARHGFHMVCGRGSEELSADLTDFFTSVEEPKENSED